MFFDEFLKLLEDSVAIVYEFSSIDPYAHKQLTQNLLEMMQFLKKQHLTYNYYAIYVGFVLTYVILKMNHEVASLPESEKILLLQFSLDISI